MQQKGYQITYDVYASDKGLESLLEKKEMDIQFRFGGTIIGHIEYDRYVEIFKFTQELFDTPGVIDVGYF
ncbi:hypothetical protein GOV11_01580 [Candidatus Woesearchaeota archaeon]|nr:hypothetical protein [Candidatus Woesearchaeota archaeon]